MFNKIGGVDSPETFLATTDAREKLKIQVISDAHYSNNFTIDRAADVVIFAGDMEGFDMTVHGDFAADTRPTLIRIKGNHEYYGKHALDAWTDEEGDFGEPGINRFVSIVDDVRFICCPLWSNFGDDSKNRRYAEICINDFTQIKGMTAAMMTQLYESSVEFLEEHLKNEWDGRTVVVTHWSPTHKFIQEQYKNDSLNTYFNNDLEWMIKKYVIDAWIFGHTHQFVDETMFDLTRIVSNAVGYPGEQTDYKQNYIIRV